MKELKINVPKGYEIDKDKSTFENIVFKEISKLPSSWEDLKNFNGYWVNSYSNVIKITESLTAYAPNKNTFKTEEQAEASIALAQLSQLRDVYRQGWKPDWKDDERKYCIEFFNEKPAIFFYSNSMYFLSFQDRKTAELFLENFRDLIEKAKPLMS